MLEEQLLKNMPNDPGVYMMKDDGDVTLYVGKAKNLKKRVRQYFQSKQHSYKIMRMVQQVRNIEYIITDNEIEALILEASLIKKHKPKYNTRLMDDKSYPYIRVTMQEPFPRVLKVRQVKQDGSRYFGPYTSAYAVDQTIDALRSIFKIRDCHLKIETGNEAKRPCLNYYIKKCEGPCVGYIAKEEYRHRIEEVLDLLNGKEDHIIQSMTDKMQKASDSMDYELAANYRDKVLSIKSLMEKQKMAQGNQMDADIISVALDDDKGIVQAFFVRSGQVTGREDFRVDSPLGSGVEAVAEEFLKQYYSGDLYVPKEIYLEIQLEEQEVIEKWLSQKRGSKVTIKIPQKGDKYSLMQLVKKNAQDKLHKSYTKTKHQRVAYEKGMEELSGLMGFSQIIKKIEAYDISNLSGLDNVGSRVVFVENKFTPSEYRRYKIKTILGQDDYGCMTEVLERRLDKNLKDLPDVIMVDGGKGHVNTAQEVLKNYGLKVPVCGMVKDKRHVTSHLIFNNQEIMLLKNTPLYRLISSIQNEVHRFAIKYHKNIRSKKLFQSELDQIPGIGERRKMALLKHFESVANIKKATVRELLKAPLMNQKIAESVYHFFEKERRDLNE